MSTQETNQRDERDSEFIDRLVFINRVSTVVKGGRRFSFAALVVVGDQKGHVGFGHGKAREVPEAIKKATDAAKATMIKVPLKEGRTLHHDIEGRHGAGKVILRSAPPGTGIIAGGPMRAVFEVLGVQDVVAKSIGSSNPYNMVRATVMALGKVNSPRQVAARRGKKVSDVINSLSKAELSAFNASGRSSVIVQILSLFSTNRVLYVITISFNFFKYLFCDFQFVNNLLLALITIVTCSS